MSRGSPSLIALLGLLAVGGYQNRDKLGELMRGRGGGGSTGIGGSDKSRGWLDQLGQTVGGNPQPSGAAGTGTGSGGLLAGLSEIVERFTGTGQADKAQSWVSVGANSPISPVETETALDEDILNELTQKTGLSRAEILTRLSDVIPDAVDLATPNGTLPSSGAVRGSY